MKISEKKLINDTFNKDQLKPVLDWIQLGFILLMNGLMPKK